MPKTARPSIESRMSQKPRRLEVALKGGHQPKRRRRPKARSGVKLCRVCELNGAQTEAVARMNRTIIGPDCLGIGQARLMPSGDLKPAELSGGLVAYLCEQHAGIVQARREWTLEAFGV